MPLLVQAQWLLDRILLGRRGLLRAVGVGVFLLEQLGEGLVAQRAPGA